MKSIFLILTVIICAVSARADGIAGTEIEGRLWHVVDIEGKRVDVDRPPSLMLKAGKVTGFTGCNRFFGKYTMAQSSLSFGSMGMTKMACANGTQLEQEFLAALGRVRTFSRPGLEKLVLNDENGAGVLQLEARPH